MVRFHPKNFPDHLALHAHARRLRSREIDRLLGEAMARVGAFGDEFMHGVARTVVPGRTGAHRQQRH